MRSSRSTAARIARPSETAPSEPLSSAARKAASAYGRATVASSAMGLELRLQLVEHLGVRACVDLALQDLLRAGYREPGDLLAQLLLGRLDLLLDLRVGARHEALALGLRLRLRLFDALARGLLRGGNDLLGARARLAEDRLAFLLRVGERRLAALGFGEAVGDGLAALLDRVHQRRPDEHPAQADEHQEFDDLDDHREVRNHKASPAGVAKSISGIAS